MEIWRAWKAPRPFRDWWKGLTLSSTCRLYKAKPCSISHVCRSAGLILLCPDVASLQSLKRWNKLLRLSRSGWEWRDFVAPGSGTPVSIYSRGCCRYGLTFLCLDPGLGKYLQELPESQYRISRLFNGLDNWWIDVLCFVGVMVFVDGWGIGANVEREGVDP